MSGDQTGGVMSNLQQARKALIKQLANGVPFVHRAPFALRAEEALAAYERELLKVAGVVVKDPRR